MILLILFAQALCPVEDDIMCLINHDLHSKPVFCVMQNIGLAGHPVVSGVTPLALFHAGEHDIARASYLGFFVNCATVLPLKYVVNRRRPSGEHIRWDASFPSGHTAFLFTQAYVLSDHYPEASVPLFVFAGVVGISRIYINKHYPSDILAGAALGLFTGFLATSLTD
jgi:membrane-associated phospholipid phosphatase